MKNDMKPRYALWHRVSYLGEDCLVIGYRLYVNHQDESATWLYDVAYAIPYLDKNGIKSQRSKVDADVEESQLIIEERILNEQRTKT